MTDDVNEAENAAKLDMWWRGLSDGQRVELLGTGSAPEWMERSLQSAHIDRAGVATFLAAKHAGPHQPQP